MNDTEINAMVAAISAAERKAVRAEHAKRDVLAALKIALAVMPDDVIQRFSFEWERCVHAIPDEDLLGLLGRDPRTKQLSDRVGV